MLQAHICKTSIPGVISFLVSFAYVIGVASDLFLNHVLLSILRGKVRCSISFN